MSFCTCREVNKFIINIESHYGILKERSWENKVTCRNLITNNIINKIIQKIYTLFIHVFYLSLKFLDESRKDYLLHIS